MKIKETYYYHKIRKERFVEESAACANIQSNKSLSVIMKLREAVHDAVAVGARHGVGEEMCIPRIYWSCGKEGYTGYVVLTMTFGENQDKLQELRKMVCQLQQVRYAYVGASGRTLKVVMPYALPDGSLPKEESDIRLFHTTAHQRATAFLLQMTGIKAEEKDADWLHGTAISVDEHLYSNPMATPVPIAMPQQLPQQMVDVEVSEGYRRNVVPDYNTLEMEVTKFNMVCRKLRFACQQPLDENILLLAEECRKAGITEEVAVKCLLGMGDMHSKELLIRTSFENAYSDNVLGNRQVISQKLIAQYMLHDFLQKRYLFRRNVITGSEEFMERSKYIAPWRPLTSAVRNSICIAAQQAGIEAWDKDLLRYLESDQIHEYDPIAEWLYDLPDWDGVDRISQLAATVHTDDERWEDDLRLWLRSMVSQWMNRGGLYGASMVLMLVGGQGTRKSTFFKRIMPEELLTYYNDRIDFTNKREAERALMRFCLINMDEFDQITRSQTAYLKHILQKSDIKWRKMYQDDIEQHRRYAAFCATTNSLTPLTDPTGSRRYLCVEVLDEIDTTYEIDYPQLYAQIVNEIRKGERVYFSAEDEQRIQQRNQRFYQEQPLEIIMQQLFAIPENETDGEWYSAVDVVQEMRRLATGIRCDTATINKVGKYLTQNRFPKRRLSDGTKYRLLLGV